MGNEVLTDLSDYDRLKQINRELGNISHRRKACRGKTGLFGALGGILLAVSLIGVIHGLLNKNSDWTANVNSPVYRVAAEDRSTFRISVPVSIAGVVLGLGLFVVARSKCAEGVDLHRREWKLIAEMRELRDKMYPHEVKKEYWGPKKKRETPPHDHPLQPDEVRNEYVGIYSPPGSHKSTV